MSRADAHPRTRHRLSAEYWFYFTPIFLTAVPAALLQWTSGVAHGAPVNPGPLRRAMSTAHSITPQIFSA